MYAYKKVSQDDLVLEEWKRYLDPTEKEVLNSELEDYDWFAVEKDGKVIAIFQIINVLNKCSKNLKIHFHPSFKQDEHNVVAIIIFIYESMLNICDKKDIKKLKLYIDDLLVHSIFMIIANHQEKTNKDIKRVQNYGKWIEIYMV